MNARVVNGKSATNFDWIGIPSMMRWACNGSLSSSNVSAIAESATPDEHDPVDELGMLGDLQPSIFKSDLTIDVLVIPFIVDAKKQYKKCETSLSMPSQYSNMVLDGIHRPT